MLQIQDPVKLKEIQRQRKNERREKDKIRQRKYRQNKQNKPLDKIPLFLVLDNSKNAIFLKIVQ